MKHFYTLPVGANFVYRGNTFQKVPLTQHEERGFNAISGDMKMYLFSQLVEVL